MVVRAFDLRTLLALFVHGVRGARLRWIVLRGVGNAVGRAVFRVDPAREAGGESSGPGRLRLVRDMKGKPELEGALVDLYIVPCGECVLVVGFDEMGCIAILL